MQGAFLKKGSRFFLICISIRMWTVLNGGPLNVKLTLVLHKNDKIKTLSNFFITGWQKCSFYLRRAPMRWNSGKVVVPFDITPFLFSERITFKKNRNTTKKISTKFILPIQQGINWQVVCTCMFYIKQYFQLSGAFNWPNFNRK